MPETTDEVKVLPQLGEEDAGVQNPPVTDKEVKADAQSKADATLTAQTFWANVGKALDKELKALPDGHYTLGQAKVLRGLVQVQQGYAGDPPAK